MLPHIWTRGTIYLIYFEYFDIYILFHALCMAVMFFAKHSWLLFPMKAQFVVPIIANAKLYFKIQAGCLVNGMKSFLQIQLDWWPALEIISLCLHQIQTFFGQKWRKYQIKIPLSHYEKTYCPCGFQIPTVCCVLFRQLHYSCSIIKI